MASAVLPEPKGERPVSLSVDGHPSSSPFPSPGSPFLPPPMPSVHEFAIPSPKNKPKSQERHTVPSDTQPASPVRVFSPITPTPPPAPEPSVTTPTTPMPVIPPKASRNSVSSLASNRPAPPSPAMSRRASGAPSSSGISLSRANSTRTQSIALSVTSVTSTSKKRVVAEIRIRDFGYPATDERHRGLGPDVPKPNRPAVINRLEVDTDKEEDKDEDEEGDESWSRFRWGIGRLSWNFGASHPSSSSSSAGGSGGDGFPSKSDLERNFVEADDDDNEDDDEFYDVEGEEDGVDEPLLPGLYKALYAFEPEGTAEMALEEDQIVRVVGRGGGVGWAVVVVDKEKNKGTQQQHALVPESYLELVQLDENR
ncbi:uncharacterized protein EV420DRAFT_1521877 [Desarmillaria tabescens]|uniref:SH3 domain-containing protein n=1 Tax=Armillaria tabescens TaxID=1929756 RepID=A0AA39NC73_ARMTA|nr:uncharacterized protein EV420DRAFT_1521877 [Desarmillaria tabescens]KAK0462955.1 hypothetical protein EV420DRAFT_1521877 [Desarmillaria tabescens]